MTYSCENELRCNLGTKAINLRETSIFLSELESLLQGLLAVTFIHNSITWPGACAEWCKSTDHIIQLVIHWSLLQCTGRYRCSASLNHSLCSLSYDRSTASFKQSATYCLLFQFPIFYPSLRSSISYLHLLSCLGITSFYLSFNNVFQKALYAMWPIQLAFLPF
jgi:hypothetical protein